MASQPLPKDGLDLVQSQGRCRIKAARASLKTRTHRRSSGIHRRRNCHGAIRIRTRASVGGRSSALRRRHRGRLIPCAGRIPMSASAPYGEVHYQQCRDAHA